MRNDYAKPPGRPALVHAVKTMPGWKWKLLGFGLSVGILGVGGQVAAHYLKTPPQQLPSVSQIATASPVARAPAGSSGFVGGQPQTLSPDASPAAAAPSPSASSPTITDMITPLMSHFGFSLVVGVVVGLIFRTFIRMALLISAVVVGGAMAASYLLHINIDLTTVKTDTSQAVSWLTDQGDRLKTMLFQVLPSSTAAGVGFLLGFKKR